jgi:hypothetical protein
MTKKEMDDFLYSIGGLENGYRVDKPPITDAYFFTVDKGWYTIIKKLIEDLIELGWDKKIQQVKEKFGGLRFYINSGSEEIFNRIRIAEKESYETCEITGKPGSLRRDISWIRTLCDDEYNKIKEELNKKNR